MSLPLLDREPAELLRALTRISHAVGDAASLGPILQLAAEQAAGLLGVERAVVLLTDDEGGLRIRAGHGLDRLEPETFTGPFDETLVTRLAPLLGEASAERILAVPLLVRRRVTGVIAAVLPAGAELAGPAELVLTALADQMAAPLENARMAEEVRQAQLLVENARLYDAERVARQAADEGRDVLQAVLAYIPEGITIADAPEVRIRLVSRFGLELLGRTAAELRGLSAEEQAAVIRMYRPGQDAPAPAGDLPLTRAIRSGAVVREEEWEVVRADGIRVPLLCDAGPIRDRQGSITGGIMAWREIAAHKRMQEQLAQAQRLQAVGKLTGGVAHEVNNMMMVVIGFGRYVLQELPPDHPRREDIEHMVRAATRSAGVTQQLLAFSRQQVLRAKVLALEPLVQRLAPLLQQLLGADKTLELRLSPSPLYVFADPGQIEQVLVNLVANGRDAMEAGGRLTIRTAQQYLDAAYARRHPGVALVTGGYAALMVSDTGRGMDAGTQARVFEPFYTTKPVGAGTGLGLATVYGIVKQSDGYIWAYSEVGRGTTIKVYLPLRTSEERGGEPRKDRRQARGGKETILVVEDEPMVRRLTGQMLEDLGYEVLQAESGDAALAIMERDPSAVDLMLSDVVMPGMSATALAEAVTRAHPALPILFMSGYPGEDVVARGLLPADAPFLQKPFSATDLDRSVRGLLERVPSR